MTALAIAEPSIEAPTPPPQQLVWPTAEMFCDELRRRMQLEHRILNTPTSWTEADLKLAPKDRPLVRSQIIATAKAFYKESIVDFVKDCVWVYEPRNAAIGLPTKLPIVPFPKQEAFLNWMVERAMTRTSAPVEKSRDSGATWMAAAFAVHMWLFYPASAFGFGSRKEDLVDRAGEPGSIFEKARIIIRNLPWYLRPEGLKEKVHFNHMRIVNPENDASIVGEAGDNIGRGGRCSVYVIDESAHLERAAKIDASLTANTDCRIDISSPLVGTIFNQWCAKERKKFVFDINDAPWHTAEWKEMKEAELSAKGLAHIFAQEYLRDSTAGIEGQLIKGKWVEAIVDAAAKLGIDVSGQKKIGLDPADGGSDPSAISLIYGCEIKDVRTNPGIQADDAGNWAYGVGCEFGAEIVKYETTGVGAGARAAFKTKEPGKGPKAEGWSPSGAVDKPEDIYYPGGVKPTKDIATGSKGTTGDNPKKNKDMFKNAKAQAWWYLRDRIYATFRAIEGKTLGGFEIDLMISLSPEISELAELKSELCQIQYEHDNAGKIVVKKTPDGFMSPNRADSVMIATAPSQIKKFIYSGLLT